MCLYKCLGNAMAYDASCNRFTFFEEFSFVGESFSVKCFQRQYTVCFDL